jgi:hypothetical protein
MARVTGTVQVSMPQRIQPELRLDVKCQKDGAIVITTDPDTAATLAGRAFRNDSEVRAILQDRIADAWYAAGCPEYGSGVV